MKPINYSRKLFGLTFLVILILMGQCYANRLTSNHQDPADWTVMLFMNADNNLEADMLHDFYEMAQIGSSAKVNIVVQLDLDSTVDFTANWTQTLRFHVRKGTKPVIKSKVVDIGEANMGDPNVLKDFIEWSISKYPAKKYALIISDHGQGYRLMMASRTMASNTRRMINNSSEQSNLMGNRPVRFVVGDPFRSSSQSPFKSCSHDETNNDQLYNSEIQSALKSALKGKKLDVLGFDACLMAMVETAYAMKDYCNYLVASQDLEPGTGWKYDDWLKKLDEKPTMDGKELSETLVASFQDAYTSATGYGDGNGAVTLSAVDTRNMANAANAISRLADVMTQKLSLQLNNIKAARRNCAVFAPNPYDENPARDYFYHVDFIRFCEQLSAITQDVQLRQAADNARNLLNNSVVAAFRGEDRDGNFGSHGLAIYFPKSDSEYRGDQFEEDGYKRKKSQYPVAFVEDHRWADFLHAYFRRVP